MEEQTIKHIPSTLLKRGVKNAYSWEIRDCGDDLLEVIKRLKIANDKMKEEFGK